MSMLPPPCALFPSVLRPLVSMTSYITAQRDEMVQVDLKIQKLSVGFDLAES